jgi:tetratricopeptide (TPR) repeat protein
VRREFVVEVNAMRLASLNALERDQELALGAPALEEAGLLSTAACETLAAFESRRDDLAAACAYLERALEPGLASGVTSDAGAGGWATRLRLAELYERSGDPIAALEQLERAYPDLPPRARAIVSLQALGLAVRADAPLDALRWLSRAREDAPDEVDAQTQLVERALQACALTALVDLDPLEQALADDDWQAAYDLGMQLPPTGAASYARLLLVASNLRVRGAADAALQLLGRALDILPDDRRVYWELVRTLSDLGRFDDAEAALQVLQGVSSQAA